MRRGRESSGVMLATVDKASQFLAYSENRGCTKLASGVVVGRERWPGGVRSDASQWRFAIYRAGTNIWNSFLLELLRESNL